MMTSTARLYLTADRKGIVDADDPRAAFLLVGLGSPITPEVQQALDTLPLLTQVKAVEAPAETKAVTVKDVKRRR